MAMTSPDGRFRFIKSGTGGGAGTAYDTENGLLVGWNELDLRGMSARERRSAARSIDLLQGLSHDHVLGVHDHWDASQARPDNRQQRQQQQQQQQQRRGGSLPWGQAGGGAPAISGEEGVKGERLVFLTRPCITLETFVETRVEFLRWRVVKRWSRQILEALKFLHEHDPPIFHKSLSLSTIYIDPSKSHLFVGGVRDIIPPRRASRAAVGGSGGMPPSGRKLWKGAATGGSGGGRGSSGRRDSWGDMAWKLVANGGMSMGCATDSAAADDGDFTEDDEDDFCGSDEEEEEEEKEDGGEDERSGGEEAGEPRDIRAFATTLIEMVLKRRLDSALAGDEEFLEMLPVISGWPASAVDLVRSCRAPPEERPSAEELLEHPFFQLGDELDDQPVYDDAELIAAAFAAASAVRAANGGSGGDGKDGPEIARQPSIDGSCPPTPPPLSWNGAGGDGGAHGYALSCSTESVSPSSTSAAPCFGGIPAMPTSPLASSLSSSTTFSTWVSPAPSGGGGAGVGGRGVVHFPESVAAVAAGRFLQAEVAPAAIANATAIAARMRQQQQQQQQRAAYSLPKKGHARSASEDVLWDMLPQDESQCRRPFSVSTVEGRQGY